MSDSTIIQIGVPVRFEWKNFRRAYSDRRRGVGAIYKMEVEVTAEDWATLETMPREANGEIVMWVTEVGGAEPKEKKEREPKGPYGQLWKHLHLAGFVNCPGVTETIDKEWSVAGEPDGEGRWETLHRMFRVESLAEVSPERIYALFPEDKFPQAKVMVEQAKRKAEKNG